LRTLKPSCAWLWQGSRQKDARGEGGEEWMGIGLNLTNKLITIRRGEGGERWKGGPLWSPGGGLVHHASASRRLQANIKAHTTSIQSPSPLVSWNDTLTKQAIVDFVAPVSFESSPNYKLSRSPHVLSDCRQMQISAFKGCVFVLMGVYLTWRCRNFAFLSSGTQ